MKKLLKTITIILGASTFVSTLSAATFKVNKKKSSVLVDVKATVDSFTGKLTDYDATITGDKASKKPGKVRFNWDFKDLETGKDKRNKKMLSWLAKGNKGSFVLSSFTKRTDGRMWAKGKMTINKKTVPVEFPCKVLSRGNNMVIRGNATIDYRKFDLPIIKMIGLLKVNPIVKVRFTLRGTVK